MTTSTSRSQAQISATRKQLEKIKAAESHKLSAFVANLALQYDDPLNYWGEYCDADFILKTANTVKELDHSEFTQKYYQEIDFIMQQSLGGLPGLDQDFIIHFCIENAAFHLRKRLDK